MELQNRKQQNTWLAIAFMVSIAVVYYMLTPLFANAGHIMIEPTGDGGKNYFGYLYHVLHGDGVWFTGMNYPYGEHVIYTDNQPLLAVSLSYINKIIPVSIPVALALMHYMILASYVMAIVFVYKILISCKVKPYLAVLFAPLVIIMSPQVLRISGHFGLCHAFYIPALVYFLLRHTATKKRKYAIYIFIMTVLMTFVHPYYAGLSLVITMMYILGYFLFAKDILVTRLKNVLPVFIAVAAALLVVQGFIKLTDPFSDRPIMPHGLLSYITENPDFLSSAYSPISHKINDAGWYRHLSEYSEGYSYIGIVTIIVLVVSFAIWYILALANLVKPFGLDEHEEAISAKIWLFVALLALLLAKGIPFKWHMQYLFDHISLFRQFRAMGRFSWVFYYLVTIYAIVVLGRCYDAIRQKYKVPAFIFILFPLCLWGYEATGYLAKTKENQPQYAEKYDWFFQNKEKGWSAFLNEHGYNAHDFQAILTIPFVHFGTEKLWLNAFHHWNIVISYRAAMQLGLPIIDMNSARASWHQAFRQVRIAGGPWTDKPMLRDLKSDKPFLFLVYDELSSGPDQEYLMTASDSIGRFSQFYVYACYPQRIKKNDSLLHNSIVTIYNNIADRDTCLSCKSTWYIDHFDGHKTDSSLFGAGAFFYDMEREKILAEVPMISADTGTLYEASIWGLLSNRNYKSPDIIFEQLDSTGAVITQGNISFKESSDNYGDIWFRAGNYYTIDGKCRKVRIRLIDPEPPSYIKLDELLLRPANAVILSAGAGGKKMVNNHIFNNKGE